MAGSSSNTTTLFLQDKLKLMTKELNFPSHVKRRIGVVKLWPEKSAAEHENIERIRIAAAKIGVDVVTIDRNGCLLDQPGKLVDSTLVDFVLNLHYETPKNYDAFSYAALWNPPDLYFLWGYETVYYHQISHEGFVSPGSTIAEDVIIRGRPREFARRSFPILNHTLAEPIIRPQRRDDRRIFYCGINWERIGNRAGRHATLLEALDDADCIEIYGPEKIHGIAPWAGYRNYRGQLPFDGVSLVKAASRAGAVLVFSSDMHRRSGIMSNRLFEALASGALIIGDSHPFIATHFSDCVLTVDDSQPAKEQARQVISHLDWANGHPTEAADLAARAQQKFIERFRLDTQLEGLYAHFLASQKDTAIRRRLAEDRELVSVLFAPLSVTEGFPANIADSLERQTSSRFEIVAAAGNDDQAKLFETALAIFLPQERFEIVRVGRLAAAPLGNFGAVIGALAERATGSILVPAQGHERFFTSFVGTVLESFASQGLNVAAASILIEHAKTASGAVQADLWATSQRGAHAAGIAAIHVRKAAYESHRPLLDHLGAGLWSQVILGGLLGPVSAMFVPQIRSDLQAYESWVLGIDEPQPLTPPDHALKFIGSYRTAAGQGVPAGVSALLEPSYHQIFDPDRFSALPIKQRQRFAAALLRVAFVPRFIYRFFHRGGRLGRIVGSMRSRRR